MNNSSDCMIETVRSQVNRYGLISITLDMVVPAFFSAQNESELYGKRVNLDCREPLAFIGPSGTGKTTLFRYFLGFPVDGTGKRIFHVQAPRMNSQANTNRADPFTMEHLRASSMSVIPQDFKLVPHISIRKNIDLAREAWVLAQKAHTELSALPDQALLSRQADRLEMYSLLDKPVASLSRGEQQRGAILRALSRPFDLLIADEAFSHLDAPRARSACELMVETADQYNAGIWYLDLASIKVPAHRIREYRV